jgi:hypothetical protein
MPTDTRSAFEPRKTPVQTRAAVTVEAISEATIQVLLSHGGDRLTTTRVAERAGVSVGTLYMMLAAISGVMRYLMEAGASPAMVRKLREHLVLLCQSYMAAATALASSEVLRQNSTWRPSG